MQTWTLKLDVAVAVGVWDVHACALLTCGLPYLLTYLTVTSCSFTHAGTGNSSEQQTC